MDMKYLLSNLTITESEIEYITDLIKVYFNIESKELPNLNVGIRRYLPTSNRSNLIDLLSEDISKFIDLVNSKGLGLNLISITSELDKFYIKFNYLGNEINLTVE